MNNKSYNVQFTGDWFSMNVYVTESRNEEDAVEKAARLILDHYDWDVDRASNDIEVYPQD